MKHDMQCLSERRLLIITAFFSRELTLSKLSGMVYAGGMPKSFVLCFDFQTLNMFDDPRNGRTLIRSIDRLQIHSISTVDTADFLILLSVFTPGNMIMMAALRTFLAMAMHFVMLWLKKLVKRLRRQEWARCNDLKSQESSVSVVSVLESGHYVAFWYA